MMKLTQDVELSIKIGLSMGWVDIATIGGVNDRAEYVPIGQALMQAFECEAICQKGDIMCTQYVQDMGKE
jgi:hypothetical protein